MSNLATGPAGTSDQQSEQSETTARRFWQTFLRLGSGVFLLESGVAVGYFACSRVVPNRGALLAIASAGLVMSVRAAEPSAGAPLVVGAPRPA